MIRNLLCKLGLMKKRVVIERQHRVDVGSYQYRWFWQDFKIYDHEYMLHEKASEYLISTHNLIERKYKEEIRAPKLSSNKPKRKYRKTA